MRVHSRALISGHFSQLITLEHRGWIRVFSGGGSASGIVAFQRVGGTEADEVLGRAGLVVVATSAGEPVVVDRIAT